MRDITKEVREISFHVMDVITDVMNIGMKKHPPYSWRDNVSMNEHLVKVTGHLFKHLDECDDGENHLNHALCRLAMAIYVRDIEGKNDKN